MKWYTISSMLVLFACSPEQKEDDKKYHEVDSILQQAKAHSDSSLVILHLAEKKTLHMVGKVSERMDSIHEKHAGLKNELYMVKANAMSSKIIQRDTIYITEKKNFWGKTKKTIDSSSSIIEDSITNK
jgi:hypothetical protein